MDLQALFSIRDAIVSYDPTMPYEDVRHLAHAVHQADPNVDVTDASDLIRVLDIVAEDCISRG